MEEPRDEEALLQLGSVIFHPVSSSIWVHRLDRDAEFERLRGRVVDESKLVKNLGFWHELYHWFQYQQTNIGQLLLGLQHARNRSIERALRADAALARALAETRAPWIDWETLRISDAAPEGASGALNEWRACELTRRLWIDQSRLRGAAFDLQQDVGLALASVDREEALRVGRSPIGAPRVILGVDGDRSYTSTTKSILELGALLMEFTAIIHHEEVRMESLEALVTRLDSSNFEDVGSALRRVVEPLYSSLREAIGNDLAGFHAHCLLLLMGCEVALSAPVPPNANVPGEVHFEQVFPPARFESIVVTLESHGWSCPIDLAKTVASPAVLSRVREWLVSESGLVDHHDAALGAHTAHWSQVVMPRRHWYRTRSSSATIRTAFGPMPDFLVTYGMMISGFQQGAFIDAFEGDPERTMLPPMIVEDEAIRSFGPIELAQQHLSSLACDQSWLPQLTRRPGHRDAFPPSLIQQVDELCAQWRGIVAEPPAEGHSS